MGKHCDALHRVHIYSSELFLVWVFACAVYPVSCGIERVWKLVPERSIVMVKHLELELRFVFFIKI